MKVNKYPMSKVEKFTIAKKRVFAGVPVFLAGFLLGGAGDIGTGNAYEMPTHKSKGCERLIDSYRPSQNSKGEREKLASKVGRKEALVAYLIGKSSMRISCEQRNERIVLDDEYCRGEEHVIDERTAPDATAIIQNRSVTFSRFRIPDTACLEDQAITRRDHLPPARDELNVKKQIIRLY